MAARTLRALLVARWVLRRGGFTAALHHYGLEQLDFRPVSDGSPEPPDGAVVRAAARVLRLPVLGSTCLPTSFALADVLDRAGVRCHLVIGVGTVTDEFSAHAWVETGAHRIDVSEAPPAMHREIGRFGKPAQAS